MFNNVSQKHWIFRAIYIINLYAISMLWLNDDHTSVDQSSDNGQSSEPVANSIISTAQFYHHSPTRGLVFCSAYVFAAKPLPPPPLGRIIPEIYALTPILRFPADNDVITVGPSGARECTCKTRACARDAFANHIIIYVPLWHTTLHGMLMDYQMDFALLGQSNGVAVEFDRILNGHSFGDMCTRACMIVYVELNTTTTTATWHETRVLLFCESQPNQYITRSLSLSELLLRQHKKHLPVCVVLNIHVIVLTFARADMPDMVSKFFISPRVFFCRHHEPHTFIVDVGFSLVALQVISFLFFNQVRLDVIECLGLWMCVVFYVGACLSGEMSYIEENVLQPYVNHT